MDEWLVFHATVIQYYAFFLVTGFICSALVSVFVPVIHDYLQDLVTTFSYVGWLIERKYVRLSYGLWWYAVVTFCMKLLFDYNIVRSAVNPCINAMKCATGRYGLLYAMFATTAQLLGAVLGCEIALFYWSWDARDIRMSPVAMDCRSDIQVSIPLAVLIESLATYLEIIVTFHRFTNKSWLGLLIKAVLLTGFDLLGQSYTGWYSNPVGASIITLGCSGTSISVHLIVYWAGPLCAAYVMGFLHRELPDSNLMHSNIDIRY